MWSFAPRCSSGTDFVRHNLSPSLLVHKGQAQSPPILLNSATYLPHCSGPSLQGGLDTGGRAMRPPPCCPVWGDMCCIAVAQSCLGLQLSLTLPFRGRRGEHLLGPFLSHILTRDCLASSLENSCAFTSFTYSQNKCKGFIALYFMPFLIRGDS